MSSMTYRQALVKRAEETRDKSNLMRNIGIGAGATGVGIGGAMVHGRAMDKLDRLKRNIAWNTDDAEKLGRQMKEMFPYDGVTLAWAPAISKLEKALGGAGDPGMDELASMQRRLRALDVSRLGYLRQLAKHPYVRVQRSAGKMLDTLSALMRKFK